MKIVEISRRDFEEMKDCGNYRFYGFAYQYDRHPCESRTVIVIKGSVEYALFKVPRNSKFQVDQENESIIVENDVISLSNILELAVYRFKKHGMMRITDRLTYYEILAQFFPLNSMFEFHPPLTYELVKDRWKWFESQIQFLKGNELTMCWTNYDLVIKYQ